MRKTWRHLSSMLCLGLLGFTSLALAQDEGLEDELDEQTVTGQRAESPIVEDAEEASRNNWEDAGSGGRLYSDKAYEGARVLSMDVDFVSDCLRAVELLYTRDYKASKAAFEAAGQKWPGSGLGPIGHVLIFQAMMLENFDYQYESQYELAAKRARQQLQEAMETPGNDAWEHFIYGGVLGVDSIHTMRKGSYLTALNRGIEAMKSVNKAKELAPEFKDVLLGDGLYNYWRTIITRSVKGMPDFGDNRSKGIELMQTVEREGIFLGPAASFALTYTWLEEGALKRALATALSIQQRYPNNVVNNLLVGRLYMYRRMYSNSEQTFLELLKISPDNQRSHYYLSRLYLRTKRLRLSETHIDKYLAFDLDKDYRSRALYAKGLIYYRRKDYTTAKQLLEQAWKVGKLKRAKRRLEKIQKIRAQQGG
jgi:tetratricopeptide (TPR) repeat protein